MESGEVPCNALWGTGWTWPRLSGGGEDGAWQRGRSQGRSTCVGLEVLWGYHDYEPDGPLISEHLIGPPSDGTHAFHGGNTVVGDEHLDRGKGQGTCAGGYDATPGFISPLRASRYLLLLQVLLLGPRPFSAA